MFVTAPGNQNNPLIQAVNANKNLKFVDIDKSGLADKLPDGKPVYEFDKVAVCSGWGCNVETICTASYLFAGPTATDKTIQAVSDVMAMSPKTITEPK